MTRRVVPQPRKPRKPPQGRSAADKRPTLITQWHPTKNGDFTLYDFTPATNIKVWCQCSCGHQWEANISNRVRGAECPPCANKARARKCAIPPKGASAAALYPHLLTEWHPTKNGTITLYDFLPGSHTRATWLCACGHEWEATIGQRAQGTGCPPCSLKTNARKHATPPKGASAADLYPHLLTEWHPTKNGDSTLYDCNPRAYVEAWWLCACGHEWKAPVYNRTTGRGCNPCGYKAAGNKRSTPPKGASAADLYPHLLTEWHPTKNGTLTLYDYKPAANTKAWWRCSCGHEWRTVICSRTTQNTRCPRCASGETSRQEQALYDLLGTHFTHLTQHQPIRKRRNVYPVDIFCPTPTHPTYNGFIVEFDGAYWHRHKTTADTANANSMRAQGYLVIRVREEPLAALHPDDLHVPLAAPAAIVTSAVLSRLAQHDIRPDR